MDTFIPSASISHPLFVYLANDGNIWAVNPSDGRGYCLAVANNQPGVDDAPADGNTYVRQDTEWTPVSIPAQQLVITGIQPASATESTTTELDVLGSGFSANSVINWGGYPLPTVFVDSTKLQAQLTLGPGSAGTYTVVATDGNAQSNSVAFVINPAATIFASGSDSLTINADGDLIFTQTQGPNAGKSVNLTYGKWT
jgi:hypothetical protein